MTQFSVPTPTGSVDMQIEAGTPVLLLGANGAGKTRLGIKIESELSQSINVHRIGAHRNLALNTKVPPPSYEVALKRLRYGYDQGNENHRLGHRWQGKPATVLLSDFDHVIAALYADENRVAVQHRQAHLLDSTATPPATKLDRLKNIWHSLLPHRELIVLDADLSVRPLGCLQDQYDAGELSDGERVIFYLIGQCLLADSGVIIIDEPELHINKSIIAKLWDCIESERIDCGFIYLTHDIDFSSSRRGSARYAVRSFDNSSGEPKWEIDPIPDETGLPEDIVTRIVGSRQSILFVEGNSGSLDAAIYRQIYNDFTMIPVGSCDGVIHSVSTFRTHAGLHRVGCAGLVDADGRTYEQIETLNGMGVFVLPVSEVENLLLLPTAFIELAKLLMFDDEKAHQKLVEIKNAVFESAAQNIESFCLRYTRRRIDYLMKSIGLSSKNRDELSAEFDIRVKDINVIDIYSNIYDHFDKAIKNQEYEELLRLYDQKNLLSSAANILGQRGRKELEAFVIRSIAINQGRGLLLSISEVLPSVFVN